MGKVTVAFTWVLVVAVGWAGSQMHKRYVATSRLSIDQRIALHEQDWKDALHRMAQTPPPSAEESLQNAPHWQQARLRPTLVQLDERYRPAYQRKAEQVIENLRSQFQGKWESAV